MDIISGDASMFKQDYKDPSRSSNRGHKKYKIRDDYT